MSLLSFDQVCIDLGAHPILKSVNLTIQKGQKLALIGRNGEGKSTLLKIMAGEMPIDDGQLVQQDGLKVAMMKQSAVNESESTVRQFLLHALGEVGHALEQYETASDPDAMAKYQQTIEENNGWELLQQIDVVTSKLKLNADDVIKSLSGGVRRRINLAAALVQMPDILLLDEPTNHLDLPMIEWLEEYLKQGKQTIFMVTHDRYFLDSVCTQILELDQQQIFKYSGGYSYYLEKKADRESNFIASTEKAQNLYRKELDWMRRQPKARGTKAKSRIDSFYQVEKRAKQQLDNEEVMLDIKMTRMGSKIVELYNLHKSYGEHVILKGFEYKFKRGDRVGIIGNNGAGKTTLLNILVGKETPDAGKVVIGDTIVVGYYTQSGMQLKADKRVIDVIRDIAEFIPMHKGQKLSAVQLCERFLFDAKKQQTYVSKLSGGEKRRLYLLTIIMKNPNFLILDEPTNDLDILTLQVLEEFLLGFPGCIVIVSHDRHFMDKIVQHTFVLEGQGIVRDFPGNYTAYREVAKQEAISLKAEEKEAAADQPVVKTASKISQEERKELKRLERQVAKLEEEKAKTTAKFNDSSLTQDQITELSKKLNEINERLEEKEMSWMELVDKIG